MLEDRGEAEVLEIGNINSEKIQFLFSFFFQLRHYSRYTFITISIKLSNDIQL